MDYFAIGKKELEDNEPAEEFFICEECQQKHPVEISRCDSNRDPITLGFYRCQGKVYLYSINGKQIK